MNHTPTPWEAEKTMTRGEFCWNYHIRAQDKSMICTVGPCAQDENMQFIVTACNAHDELVEALKDMTAILAKIQNTLTGYLIPDSALDQDECINEILNITDHENTLAKQRRALQALAKAEKGR